MQTFAYNTSKIVHFPRLDICQTGRAAGATGATVVAAAIVPVPVPGTKDGSDATVICELFAFWNSVSISVRRASTTTKGGLRFWSLSQQLLARAA